MKRYPCKGCGKFNCVCGTEPADDVINKPSVEDIRAAMDQDYKPSQQMVRVLLSEHDRLTQELAEAKAEASGYHSQLLVANKELATTETRVRQECAETMWDWAGLEDSTERRKCYEAILHPHPVSIADSCGCVGCDIGTPVMDGRHGKGENTFPCSLHLHPAQREVCEWENIGNGAFWSMGCGANCIFPPELLNTCPGCFKPIKIKESP